MDDRPAVLLTNDDGIDATGLEAIERAVSAVASVTVVAPATNQSGVSRADSRVFDVEQRDRGYAVAGTPADCVQFGLGWLDTSFDLVLSGCNDGPNLGAHRLSRSGTVAGAIEAAFLGVPGVALSVYDPPEGVREFHTSDYEEAGRVAQALVRVLLEREWPFEYLNVNVPATADDPRVRVTAPVRDYDLSVSQTDEGAYHVWDHFWDPLRPDAEGAVTDPVGTDRRALADEEVSVTPLRPGQEAVAPEDAPDLADACHRELDREP